MPARKPPARRAPEPAPAGPPGPLFERSSRELLERFAAGATTPGAGSAAALAGALAGSLLQAVAIYTLGAAGSEAGTAPRERPALLLEEARQRARRLGGAVDEDAAAFERYRRERSEEALLQATEVPLAIAEDCAALAEIGLELYDQGFARARAESAAAALAAVAGAEAALYAARVNLRSATAAAWAGGKAREVESLLRRLAALRRRTESRLYEGDPPG